MYVCFLGLVHTTRRNLKTLALRLSDRKHFENQAFRKRRAYDNHDVSVPKFYSNTNPKWSMAVAFSDFSGVVWTGPKEQSPRGFRSKVLFHHFPIMLPNATKYTYKSNKKIPRSSTERGQDYVGGSGLFWDRTSRNQNNQCSEIFNLSVISFIFYINRSSAKKDECTNTNPMAPVFSQVYLNKRNQEHAHARGN